ncbi:helix-turn-helix domain-containing protein [Corynebacterium pyruviciproducens]
MAETILTEQQAAEFLNVSVQELQTWRAQSKGLPFIVSNGRVFYAKTHCEQCIFSMTHVVYPKNSTVNFAQIDMQALSSITAHGAAQTGEKQRSDAPNAPITRSREHHERSESALRKRILDAAYAAQGPAPWGEFRISLNSRIRKQADNELAELVQSGVIVTMKERGSTHFCLRMFTPETLFISDYFNLTEAAEQLRMPRSTLGYLVRTGRGPKFEHRSQRRYYFNREDLRQFVKESRR